MIGLFSVVALGFFLGIRHATDADHVIAVSTIVSRYRSVKHAVAIGALWGVGHTLTILLVGGGIILFGWVIPARIGLSMELSLGLTLILLGVLNLTGILQWITNNFSHAQHHRGVSGDHDHGCAAAQHSHAHTHGDYVHTHPHAHDPEIRPHDPAPGEPYAPGFDDA
jgi:high-affinity nickel permease